MRDSVLPVAQRRVLFAIAAPVEGRAALRGLGVSESLPDPWTLCHPVAGVDLVMTGVGKANAAAGVARVLDPVHHRAVINLGIAGSLPCGPGIASCVLATTSIFADEGVLTAEGFTDIAALGFSPSDAGIGVPGDPRLVANLAPLARAQGPVACVSTCSGTDSLASEIAARTRGIAEAMEGAGAGLAAYRLGVPFAEFRVISNHTGDRARQAWDLPGSLAVVSAVIGPIVKAVMA